MRRPPPGSRFTTRRWPQASQFASRARELGLEAIPLEQDRVRLLRRILAGKPVSLWGVSRHADQLLANGIMREHGYRAQLALRHQGYQPITPGCGQASRMAAAMSRVASDQWPIAFAEMAAGRSSLCEASQREKMDRATICWSFTLAGALDPHVRAAARTEILAASFVSRSDNPFASCVASNIETRP
jgi:hypothetical protein